MHDSRQISWKWWLTCALLVVCYLCLRLPNLRDWPPFCDEATYARWAQLVRADPVHNLWVSMEDAKPPIHAWLLALTRPLAEDPITAGRLLSVLFGAATIPFLLLLCAELRKLLPRPNDHGLLLGTLASALMITCPLIALHQRMALAESLLLLDSIMIAWLSLRLARHICEAAPAKQIALHAILLGFVWGITLLTKQNFSYLLWALPIAALVAWIKRGTWLQQAKRFSLQYLLATAIGLAMFIPVLFTDSTLSLSARLFYKSDFYPQHSRWASIWSNLILLLSPRSNGQSHWWPYDPSNPLDDGWLYIYLTPPILTLAVIGICWMARRREWRPMLYLGVWCFALLGLLVIVGGSLWSRYLVLGVMPLLLIVAWFLADQLAQWRQRMPVNAYIPLAATVVAFVFAWPACAVAWSVADWRAPTLVTTDVGQYVTRPCAGLASEEAVAWLKQRAQHESMAVVTGTGIGLPNDITWLGLRDVPNVQTYWSTAPHPLQTVSNNADTYLLGAERWIEKTRRPVAIAPNQSIYLLISRLHQTATNQTSDVISLDDMPKGTHIVQVFPNPPAPRDWPNYELLVVEVPPKNQTIAAQKNDVPLAAAIVRP
jgi:4-amino-4-deoxy-L-arabinose transferase-like glycosyltransferase